VLLKAGADVLAKNDDAVCRPRMNATLPLAAKMLGLANGTKPLKVLRTALPEIG
jgi:hypothetical protein